MKHYVIFLLTLIFVFSVKLKAQSLYNGIGHIPQNCQVKWTNAGLLPDRATAADNIFDVTLQSGANWDEKIDEALDKAKSTPGLSIIYFPAGTYVLNSTIELTQSDGNNIVFQGDGSDVPTLKFKVGKSKSCFYIHGAQTGGTIYLNSNIDKGTKEIAANDFSSLQAKDWIRLSEYNYPVHSDWAKGCVGQITQLESVSGISANMKDEASKSYSDSVSVR